MLSKIAIVGRNIAEKLSLCAFEINGNLIFVDYCGILRFKILLLGGAYFSRKRKVFLLLYKL